MPRITYSSEVEESILGAMLMSETALNIGVEELSPHDFYVPANRAVFNAVVELFEKRSVVDSLTVADHLERKGQLEEIGGRSYIASLVVDVVSPSLIKEHIPILHEYSMFRDTMQACNDILEDAGGASLTADELLDKAENRILDIRQRRLKEGFFLTSKIVDDAMKQIIASKDHKDGVTGLHSGFTDLDKRTSGFQNGDLVVIASRPSTGKTALVLNIHHHLSIVNDIPTAMFSLEMSREQIVYRLLAMDAPINSQVLRSGWYDKRGLERITKAASRLRKAKLYLDDSPILTLTEMRAKARRIVRENGVRLISVDYIGLLEAPPRADNREREVAMISKSLKVLAKELNIPVLAVSQLSRASEKRTTKGEVSRPMLSDLRDSGAIEQDADVVIFLFRMEQYDSENPDYRNLAEVIISKQRNGPTGTVKLNFFKDEMRFADRAESAGYYDDGGETPF